MTDRDRQLRDLISERWQTRDKYASRKVLRTLILSAQHRKRARERREGRR